MSELARFLQDVLLNGSVQLIGPPTAGDDPAALIVLRRAHDSVCLSLAGPMLPMDEPTALAAAQLLWRSAWYLLNPHLAIENPETTLGMPTPPNSVEQHLSADVTLRFLATLHRRAKAFLQNDVLPAALEETLRQWPLSGVLADIAEPPVTPVDFGQHPGVNFLYAERLAERERAGWFPLGQGREYVELIWSELGKDASSLPALAEIVASKNSS